ncbi:hypothetical protein ACFLRF_00595 [Candidatus Altiarchaeota archaeon]
MEGDWIKSLASYHSLTEGQAGNLEGIGRISKRFHEEAGISPVDPELSDVIVLESGHQPNFLPYSGVWKKAFLLHHVAERLRSDGHKVMPVFGFADYNLSTASLLYQNKLPDSNKDGYRKIGFHVEKKDKWKRFNRLPEPDGLEGFISDLRKHYKGNAKRARVPWENIKGNADEFIGLLEDAHKRAGSFADFNAMFIASILTGMGLELSFFKYTHVQAEAIFLEETRDLAVRTAEYNRACNGSLVKRGLEDLGVVEDYFFPLWHHCDCGGKVSLSMLDDICQGRCPVCDKGSRLEFGKDCENLERYYKDVAPTAIARNLIFSQGLGTTLFISGTGGGLRYGQIANDASDAMGYHKPVTAAWRGKDYYVGVSQAACLNDLGKALDVPADKMGGDLKMQVQARRQSLENMMAGVPEEERKTMQKYKGMMKNIDTRLNITSQIFKVVPSATDLFINFGLEGSRNAWADALCKLRIEDGEFKLILADSNYGSVTGSYLFEDIPSLFRTYNDLSHT